MKRQSIDNINCNHKISKKIFKVEYIILSETTCFLNNAIILSLNDAEKIHDLIHKYNNPPLVLYGLLAQKYYCTFKKYNVIMTNTLDNL